jgi:integrase
MDLNNDPLIQEYIQNHGIKPNTIIQYKKALNIYCNFLGMTPNELIEEAEDEEETRIRMRRRKIKSHLLNFKDYLNTKDHTVLTVRNYITIIRSFYREFDIELPKMYLKTDNRQESREDIPTKDDIKIALKYANPRYRAIILLMSSSGMGASEIISLSINDFLTSLKDYISIAKTSIVDIDVIIELIEEKRKENPLMISTWHITRVKTEMPYITFSSPESLDAILDYLKIEPPINIKDPLFRGPKNNRINNRTFHIYFNRLNKKCGFGKPDRQAFLRSHNLRKYFATTISEQIPKLKVDRMLGHRVDSLTNSYFKTNLPELKEAYIQSIPSLSIESTKVKTYQSPEFTKVQEKLDEKDEEFKKLKAEKDEEMKDLKKKMELMDEMLKSMMEKQLDESKK